MDEKKPYFPYDQKPIKHSPPLLTMAELDRLVGVRSAQQPPVTSTTAISTIPAPPAAGLEQEHCTMTQDDFDRAVIRELQASGERHATPLFEARTAADWLEVAARTAIPHMLFDTMWYEGDLCILFADTNLGKSILAVQIADSISRGVPIAGFSMDAPAQPVAYFDFELSAKQFQARYTCDFADPYVFSDRLIRLELDINTDYVEWGFKTFEAFLHDQLEQYIQHSGTKVLIIDNITYLRSEAEHARDAYSLMNMLITLKKKYGLSLLVLAHTPKRDNSRPIEVNHLQGSKQIANLSDSIITIGKSYKDNGLRYIKQIKHRRGEKMYEEDNVCLCQIAKPHNFLHFEFIKYSTEREHLREIGDKEMGQRITAAKDLSAQGLSQREIASRLGISVSSVNKYLNR